MSLTHTRSLAAPLTGHRFPMPLVSIYRAGKSLHFDSLHCPFRASNSSKDQSHLHPSKSKHTSSLTSDNHNMSGPYDSQDAYNQQTSYNQYPQQSYYDYNQSHNQSSYPSQGFSDNRGYDQSYSSNQSYYNQQQPMNAGPNSAEDERGLLGALGGGAAGGYAGRKSHVFPNIFRHRC